MAFTVEPDANLPQLMSHLELLEENDQMTGPSEIQSTPIFTESVRKFGLSLAKNPFVQYGLLGGDTNRMMSNVYTASMVSTDNDPRLYYNVTAPSSVFICGSQGSGKSHTLSCLLENCLIPTKANQLPRPLTGIVFHYDTFCSDNGGSPSEAAYLSSNPDINVKVLCPPTNIDQIKRVYSRLPNVKVEELRFDQADLNTKRMLDLMAVSSVQGGMPLYLHVITRILRELRIIQQKKRGAFEYAAFKRAIDGEELTPGQKGPLQQRLETLESFMVEEQVSRSFFATKKKNHASLFASRGNDWTPMAGQLTIIDLSCPCVTAETACALFNICLSLFLEQKADIGRVVALDEAHKYMTDSAECATLTETLLATIRLQRHLAARVIISTQEPTISPKLLDLCSITIVHRFSSPDWLRSLKGHLAGASAIGPGSTGDGEQTRTIYHDATSELFSQIVALRTGEALLFASSAILAVSEPVNGGANELKPCDSDPSLRNSGVADVKKNIDHEFDTITSDTPKPSQRPRIVRLEQGVLRLRVRQRITEDGGQSIMAG
ncbi:hypothetical protein RJ55_05258 [Drechmeria coniospora]|nr:hypothetical protein RJ55_05258 [Drechmeria coniospora]